MKKVFISVGFDDEMDCAYLRTRTAMAKLSLQDQKRFLEQAVTEIETAIFRLNAVSSALARSQVVSGQATFDLASGIGATS